MDEISQKTLFREGRTPGAFHGCSGGRGAGKETESSGQRCRRTVFGEPKSVSKEGVDGGARCCIKEIVRCKHCVHKAGRLP